jgi:hypothetical protein
MFSNIEASAYDFATTCREDFVILEEFGSCNHDKTQVSLRMSLNAIFGLFAIHT